MNKTGLFSLILIFLFVFNVKSQKKVASILNTETNLPLTSNIIQLNDNDTSYVKVIVKGANYQPLKNNLPYYSIIQSSNQLLEAKISDVVSIKVSEPSASVIKKYFGKILTNEFDLVDVSGISAGKIINQYQLTPFKINNLNQVEELVSYKINWVENQKKNLNTKSTATFVTNSILSTGNWFKIGTGKTGVYKIDKSFLTKMGIDVSTIDPKKIKLYGNGGNALPELNSATVIDDLKENAIKVIGESDGVFNDNDYILFYAKGSQQLTYDPTNRLKFNLNNNIYSDSSFYFLNFENSNGLRIGATSTPSNIVNSTNSYDYVAIEEKNDINFIKSGREFYGQFFDITSTYNFSWNDGNFVLNDSLIASVTMAGRSFSPNFYTFNVNGISQSFTISNVGTYYLDPYANVVNTVAGGANNNINSINLGVTKLSSSALAWFD